jgi:hypothetical protein
LWSDKPKTAKPSSALKPVLSRLNWRAEYRYHRRDNGTVFLRLPRNETIAARQTRSMWQVKWQGQRAAIAIGQMADGNVG